MKTIYLFGWVLLMCLSLNFQSKAQCSLVDPAVELNSVITSGENCIVNVNLSFTIDKNNGNKFTYVHLWKPSEYPDIDYKKAPKAADLGAVLATLAIDTDGEVSILPTYSADVDNVIPLTGLSIIEEDLGGDISRITINNIQFPVPGACVDLPILKGDVWSTQAASANPTVHCFNENFNLQINDPVITGLINCNDPSGPRTYDLDIISTSPTPFEVTYKLYLDDGVLTNGEATFGADDELIYTSPPTNLSALEPIASKDQPYAYDFLEDQRTIWVVLTAPSLPNSIVAELKNNCLTTLPVELAKFEGNLLDNAITLSWTTTEEAGSSHFNVERSSDLLEFSILGRVNAKGNSGNTVHYNFVDRQPLSGNNYYRLRMVDLDGSSEKSRIISVANYANSVAFELLGNPVVNKEIKFILKNDNPGNIRLSDMAGRSIGFSLNRSGNTFTLTPKGIVPTGLYLLSLEKGKSAILTKKVLIP
ncbi:T9SS type A sorting domain-containing protein [Dyadobacter sp. MSC1_007]|jgi:hypothetical protein|uniref:T9SS type A sorting domain-containing protein n=1 Tax=Dyadobacter sp. MSC1_007 TaxID=2909264 RepID=UPI00203035A7|nr:T9SS C-terminal target domain-containing protein [Dyadobacter sp. MSC1_007]